MSRASWGKAKLEVKSLSSEILGLTSEGLNLEEIYNVLCASDKLTIGKSTFKRHASDIIVDNRTLTLKRLLNDRIITSAEFNHRVNARIGPPARSASTPTTAVSTDTAPTDEASPPRSGRTVIPGSSLKRGGFNDPDLRVATNDLLDQVYGTSKSSLEQKPFVHDPNDTDTDLW